MNLRPSGAIVGTLALLLTATGCVSNGGTADSSADAEVTLTLGHPGTETEETMTRFAELVEEKSGGTLHIDAFPSSTLGTSDEMLEGLQLGTTDIVIESIVGLEPYTDLATIESVPFLYEDDDQFLEVWNGDIGERIRDTIAEDSGYRLLGAMYRGARELTTKEVVDELGDLKGLTIRTPSAPTMIATWEALGARAEAMPYTEIYSAIESGVNDWQENPLGTIQFNSFQEVAPNIAETDHVRMNYHFIMWDERLTDLSDAQRAALLEAIDEVSSEFTDQTLSDTAEYRAELEEKGAVFHELKDRDAWIAATSSVVDSLSAQVQEWVTEIRG